MLCFLTVSSKKQGEWLQKTTKTHQKPWQKPRKLQQNKWKKAGDCISQQCSICNIFRSFSWLFAGSRPKKVRTKPKNSAKIHQKLRKKQWYLDKTMGKHTKQMEKGWEWDFSAALSSTQQHSATLSSTQQHSAALSSAQSATNFKVFLTFCRPRVKIEKESKK